MKTGNTILILFVSDVRIALCAILTAFLLRAYIFSLFCYFDSTRIDWVKASIFLKQFRLKINFSTRWQWVIVNKSINKPIFTVKLLIYSAWVSLTEWLENQFSTFYHVILLGKKNKLWLVTYQQHYGFFLLQVEWINWNMHNLFELSKCS